MTGVGDGVGDGVGLGVGDGVGLGVGLGVGNTAGSIVGVGVAVAISGAASLGGEKAATAMVPGRMKNASNTVAARLMAACFPVDGRLMFIEENLQR
jgi:hypothetical protein